MTATPATPATRTEPTACPTCGVAYRASLTGGCCPVCDTPAPGGALRRPRVLESSDDRLLAIVGAATVANVLLLAVLTLLVLRA